MAELFRKKHIRQAIFFTGFILFLLSLFEWSGEQMLLPKAESTGSAQIVTSTISVEHDAKTGRVNKSLNDESLYDQYVCPLSLTFPPDRISPFFPERRFLRFRSLLI